MNCDTAAAFFSTSSETGKNTRYVFGKNSDRHVGETQLVEHFHPHDNLLQETVVGTHNTKISVSKLAKLTFDKLQQINNNNDTNNNNNLTVSSFSEKYFSTSLANVISRPHHMFGAEMGFNANGVTLGNEAVFCPPKIPSAKRSFRQKQQQSQSDDAVNEDEIIGMDALRLAVSFAQDSVFACAIIAAMTEFFDVGDRGFRGDCGDGNGAVEHYHNAFLICDPERILKMFCLGEHWCIVDENKNNNTETSSFASWHAVSISNFLPFGITKSEIIASSSKFYEFAKFDNANNNDNNCLRTNIMSSSSTWFKLMDYFANGAQRECVTKCLLQEGLNRTNAENVDLADFCFSAMAAALRAHGSAEESKIRSSSTATGNNNNCQGSNCGEIGVPLSEFSSLSQISVCMHGGVGPVRVNQTANSLIVVVEKKGFAGSISIRAFSTEAPNPCISVFTPILFHSHNNNVNNDNDDHERARLLGLTNARRCSVITEVKTKRRWGQFEEIIRRCTILGVEQYLNEFAKECRKLEQSILTSTSTSDNCSVSQLHPFEAFDCENKCETRRNLDRQIRDQVLDLLHEWWKRTSSVNNLKSVKNEDEGVVISIFQWMLSKK